MNVYLRVAARVASSPAGHRLNCSSTSPNISPLSWNGCLPESAVSVASNPAEHCLRCSSTSPTSHYSAGMDVYLRARQVWRPVQLDTSPAVPAPYPTSHHLAGMEVYLRVAARVASNPARHRPSCSSTSPNLSPLSWDGCLPESGSKGGVHSSRTSHQLFQHLTQPLTTQLR
jgi:hypothetical protein